MGKQHMTHDEKLTMVEAMHRYGGGFVIALSECFVLADHINLEKLCEAFPEIVARYLEIAAYRIHQEEG